ncbi:glucuronoxylan 4-O-methyltransferase 1-like [Humulus lupulus]|uniref:glucuronoxylan 4-O-methyltransferase 1-like n=1 Tax=Humulus lupulus TaxID=3486 RepID=UPI002B413E07|nr:glucuronoxylan 4-O-methyltransferase 1-like [Humulus lupulus]
MRTKVAQLISLKLTLSLFFLFFLILIIRSNFSFTNVSTPATVVSQQTHLSNSTDDHDHDDQKTTSTAANTDCANNININASPVQTCNKTPPSLANALVHYVTTNITPQQTLKEISVSMRILEKKSPCNFLVFGLGHDSLMWNALNYGGRTVFLEEDKAWIEQIQRRIPGLESYHVEYDTKVHQADELMKIGSKAGDCQVVGDPRFSKCQLALKNFPSDVYDTEWDLIMVDAPTGYVIHAPGRMTAIYTAGLMARNRESGETDVFVHDVDRPVEDKFSKAFLCEGYLTEEEGRLRHFTIPSHRARLGRPFCP